MKYLLKWSKEGEMKYISHLDIMRLFQRALKRSEIKLRYSEGYSPHPKMSIVQPLSLGYTSTGEYIEFETQEVFESNEILSRLNSAMPEGIKVLSSTEISETKKAVGALITKGKYLIGASDLGNKEIVSKLIEAVEWFNTQEIILHTKIQKKSGKQTEINVREKVKDLRIENIEDDRVLLSTIVDTGSYSNLNPELIILKLKERMKNLSPESSFHIQREEMYTENENGELIPLYFLK